MIGRIVVGVLLAWGTAPAVARAQQGTAPGAERPARTEAFKMVDAYVMSNLQESLGLSDAEMGLVFSAFTLSQAGMAHSCAGP